MLFPGPYLATCFLGVPLSTFVFLCISTIEHFPSPPLSVNTSPPDPHAPSEYSMEHGDRTISAYFVQYDVFKL